MRHGRRVIRGEAGPIRSLGELGIRFEDDGTLTLDKSKLQSGFANDPEAVKTFFAHDQFGLAARLNELIERLSGEGNSLLGARLNALNAKIEENEERIARLNARLDVQRERLYLEFYRMELALGRLQANFSAVDSIQPMPSYILGAQE